MKLYVATKWTNAEGTHEVGDQVELPTGTDLEQAEVDALVSRGILSTASLGGSGKSARKVDKIDKVESEKNE